jgi:hypothetical protein
MDLQTLATVTQIVTAVAIALLTLVLVGATLYYAKKTADMAVEMRIARHAQVLPHVVASMTYVGPNLGWIRVTNVGVGPAIDVDVRVRLVPGDDWDKRVVAAVLAPGEHKDLVTRPTTSGPVLRLSELSSRYQSIHVTGTCRDALGETQAINSLFDIREWWEVTQAASIHWKRDPMDELVKHVGNAASSLEGVEGELRHARLSSAHETGPEMGELARARVHRLQAKIEAWLRRWLGRERAHHRMDPPPTTGAAL